MVNDPIADLIVRIKNASVRGKDVVELPWTKMRESISNVLKEAKFLEEVQVKTEGNAKKLELTLHYNKSENIAAITGIKRISKPGVRRYVKSDKITRVLGGAGMVVLSTSKGIMSGEQARKSNLGGEVLFEIW